MNLRRPEEVEKMLNLRQYSYDIFQWLNSGLKDGSVNFHIQKDSYRTQALATWLKNNQKSLPSTVPWASLNEEDKTALFNLVASFIEISFNYHPGGSVGGCDCGYGAEHQEPHYALRNPTNKDREDSLAYLQICWSNVSGTTSDVTNLKKTNADLYRELVVFGYVEDVFRRAENLSHTPVGLVLWKELKGKNNKNALPGSRAEKNNKKNMKVKITSRDYFNAIKKLQDQTN